MSRSHDVTISGFDLDRLEAELAKAVRERDEARGELEDLKVEYEIMSARLRGQKHERDNGIVSHDEIIPKLIRERDEARAALQRLADCDWVISLPDRMDAVREIARVALEKMEAASHVSHADADGYHGRELAHLAGVVGALRDRNDRLMGLLRDVERETRRPSERFDEAWAEVREVLRG